MLSQNQIPEYIVNELPEIKQELESVAATLNILKIIKCPANYTRIKVMQHDLKAVKKCFAVADNIYSEGNTIAKNAIENVFVCSCSSFMNIGTKSEKRELHALVPLCLYTAYVRQVLKPET